MTTKLIRLEMDNRGPIPDHLEKGAIKDIDLIRALLAAKLHEEAAEVAAALTAEEALSELGDAWEVIEAIAMTRGFKGTDVIMAAATKRATLGGLVAVDAGGEMWAMLQRPK